MPAFTFEKISPPDRRAPATATTKKPRGFLSQMIDRFAERRASRVLGSERAPIRSKKPEE